MNTLKVSTDKHGIVVVNHNSDWSGDVIVRWDDAYTKEFREIKLPGALLIALSVESARDELKSQLIDFLEQL